MKRLGLVFFVALLHVAVSSSAQQQVPQDRKGETGTVKLEQVISGYLTDINGKYKLRVSESNYGPGGYIGEHQHVGPGIRYIVSGEWTRVVGGKTVTQKTGDYWYSSGDITGSASNKTNSPVRIINFEILPADWKGGSAIPPK